MKGIADMWRLHRIVTGWHLALVEDYQALDLFEGFEQVDACNLLIEDLQLLALQAEELAQLAEGVRFRANLNAAKPQAHLDADDARGVERDAWKVAQAAAELQTEITRWHNL